MPSSVEVLEKPRTSRSAASPDHQQRFWLAVAAIFLLAIFAYLPVTDNGWIWDDDDYVVENQTLRDLGGLRDIWLKPGATPQYYPLVHTTFWTEYHLWGLNPKGYHVTNVLLHAGSAALLFLLLRMLGVPGAWLAGAIFALHPVQVESVAWVTERKNVLSGLFYFASALCYLRFALNPPARGRPALYGAAFVLFLGGMLSKTVVCSLPAALLLILWWKRGRLSWRDALPLLPFFALGISLGLVTVEMEKTRVGATGKEWDFTFVERCLIAGRALWFYAAKLLLPYKLTFIYPRWKIDGAMTSLYLFPAMALGVMALLWALRERIGRAPLVAVLIFAGTLFPALGFFNVYPMRYSFVADHFQYHASAALIALFAAGLAHAARRVPSNVAWMGAGALLFIYAGLTWKQTHIYKDYATVWEDTLAKDPNSPIGLTSVASVRVSQGKTAEAMELYRRAIAVNPEDDVAHFNLGKLLVEQGQNPEAREHLARSVEITPACSHCHYFLAVTLSQMEQAEKALAHYAEAIRLDPNEPFCRYNYAVTLSRLGRADDAIQQYQESIRLKPDNGVAWFGLRDELRNKGDAVGAEKLFREILTRSPGVAEGYVCLADALMGQGKPDQAVTALEEAVRLRPGYDEAVGRLQALRQARPQGR